MRTLEIRLLVGKSSSRSDLRRHAWHGGICCSTAYACGGSQLGKICGWEAEIGDAFADGAAEGERVFVVRYVAEDGCGYASEEQPRGAG